MSKQPITDAFVILALPPEPVREIATSRTDKGGAFIIHSTGGTGPYKLIVEASGYEKEELVFKNRGTEISFDILLSNDGDEGGGAGFRPGKGGTRH